MSAEDRLRTAALALPGVEERERWGKPTFAVAGRLFLTLAPDGSSATMKARPSSPPPPIWAAAAG